KLLGHGQAEMGGFHCDVGVESLGGDPVQTLEVAVHRRQGSLLVVDLLSEEVEGDLKAVCVERSGHRHRLVEGVARHETTGQCLAGPGAGDGLADRPQAGHPGHHLLEDRQETPPGTSGSLVPSWVERMAAARTASSTSAREPRASRTCMAAAVVPPGEVTSYRSSTGLFSVSVSR